MQVCINNANRISLIQDGCSLYQLDMKILLDSGIFMSFRVHSSFKRILDLEISRISSKYENIFKELIGCNQKLNLLIASCSEEIYFNIKKESQKNALKMILLGLNI